MPRPAGVRNHDFDEKRASLLNALTEFALDADLRRPSLRQFAIAVNQSEPTLRHYFGDRQGLVIEIIENIRQHSLPIWDIVNMPADDPAQAVKDYLDLSEKGMQKGRFTRAHAFGLIEGLADELVGKAYLEKMLHPALKVFAEKLRATPGGPRDPDELMAATFAATAPIILMGVHQELLGGSDHAPVDMSRIFGFLNVWLSESFTAQAES